MDQSHDSASLARRVTVAEAAALLGITQDAVRKRIERNKIEHERGQDGRLYVFVDPSETVRDTSAGHESSALISEMRDRIESLERLLEQANERDRENRRIIAALTSRIPELAAPAPQEPPGAPETATDEPGRGDVPGPAADTSEAEPVERVSWWRRMLRGG